MFIYFLYKINRNMGCIEILHIEQSKVGIYD